MFANPLQPNTLKGVWGTLQIPFNTDDTIDYPLLNEGIDFLVRTSLHGIYSNGTAGEFYNQTEVEFDKINEMLAERCKRTERAFQIGASHMSPIISLERIRRAKALNPQAFQVIFPDWLPMTIEEQILFMIKIAEEANPIPIVLYLPGHAKTKLSVKDLEYLSDHIPGLIGIKTAMITPDRYADMRKLNQRMSVFIPGHHLATGIKEKIGSGSYSNVACINPDAARKWYDIMLSDVERGMLIENMVRKFFDEEIIPLASRGYSDPALDKLLAAVGGKIPANTRLRWPYKSADDKQVVAVRAAARKILPDFFDIQ